MKVSNWKSPKTESFRGEREGIFPSRGGEHVNDRLVLADQRNRRTGRECLRNENGLCRNVTDNGFFHLPPPFPHRTFFLRLYHPLSSCRSRALLTIKRERRIPGEKVQRRNLKNEAIAHEYTAI